MDITMNCYMITIMYDKSNTNIGYPLNIFINLNK